MRLIDTATLRLQDFSDLERPKYAILSHTWGKEEVSLQEWMEWEEGDPNQKTRIEAKSGFKKIANACRIARLDGHPYIWVDTNCIDKKSSAELSEAINSMFSWYQASRVCFAYLEDFPAETTTKDLSRCRWFTRGWTLQELLAPRRVTFFDSAWESVGTKTTLRTRIREATCIEAAVLRDPAKINTACAAKKMSWASSRQTTRVEDMAYCLLGLFNINMPLLYGEGNDAFRRLQEEIIKVSTDQSLFAWDWPSTTPKYYLRGLHSVTTLAPFPSAFGKCHDVVRDLDHELQTQPRHREYAMTNFGLNIALPLLIEKQGARYGALNCRYKKLQDFLICIPLSIHDLTGTFYRDDSRDLIIIPRRYFLGQPTSILLPRYSESQHYALSPSFLRPQDGEVSFLLFTSNRDLGLWEIRTSWGYMRASQRLYIEGKDIPHDIRANTVTVRKKNTNTQWVFVILWTPECDWGHVCVKSYYGDPENDVGGDLLQRTVVHAPCTGEATAFFMDFELEVGFRYSTVSSSGGRWLPLFLKRSPETMDQ